MSQINNRIVTTFTSSAGNAIAVMNQMSGGMTNLGRAAYQSSVMSERMNAQWRAFGTTIRYAVAGSVIFGATRLLSVLRDTQRQYALIGAISGGAYNEQIVGAGRADSALAQLYQNAQSGAMEAITPVNDFNDALVNLFSTIDIQGADKGDKAVELVTAISQGAQLATVPVDDLTRSVTGMNQAFGRVQNMKNIQQGIRGFTELVYRAPGGIAYGPQFIQQLAPLGAVSRLSNITPEQMYGLFLTETRIGQTPATAGRGLQFLLQSIAAPHKTEAAALRQAGVTPELVQQKGGVWAIRQIIDKMKTMGISGDLKKASNMSDESLDALADADPATQRSGLGISGRGIEYAQKAIGRIHGVRALIALLAQEESSKQMTKDQEFLAAAMADTEQAQKIYADRWKQFAREQPLQAAAVSLDVMRRSILTAFEPGINFGAKQITRGGAWVKDHPKIAHRAAIGAALGLGAFSLAKGGGLFGLLNRGGQAAVTGMAARDLAVEAATRGASPALPLYVTVVGQLVGGGSGPLGGPSGGPPVVIPPGGPKAPGRWGRVKGFGRTAGRASVWAAWALAALDLAQNRDQLDDLHTKDQTGWLDWNVINQGTFGTAGFFRKHGNESISGMKRLFGGDGATDPNIQKGVNQWFRAVTADGGKGGMAVLKGEASVTVDVNLNHADGSVQRKRVHVPVDLWQGGKVPSNRGKKATHRGGPN